jgi:ATP-dependent RNA helicase RhlB
MHPMTDQHLTNIEFSSLDLPEPVLQGLEEAGFKFCTPIQAQSLPLALAGKDVAGQAQTGTGKTAAFLLATFDRLIRHPADERRRPNQPRAFMLAPTRELALQIHKDAVVLGAHTGFKLALAYGGTGYDQQRQEIEAGVDILVGTPGRLIDYFKQKVFDLRAVEVAVIDEADRMFDLGFIKDLRYLLRRLPPPDKRLSMLFSATLSYRVKELAYEHMNNPESVTVETDSITVEKVREQIFHPANDEKIPLLLGIMGSIDPKRTIVFVNTKRAAERVWGYLEGNGCKAAILSGDIPQKKRERLLKQFKTGELPVLVATDVASRGLHIPDVTHVINFDLPDMAEDYVHRIGRTARAGAEGDAISFACEDYAINLPEIEEYIGHKIPSAGIDHEMLVEPKPRVRMERSKKGPPRGGRPGGGRPRGDRQGSGRGGHESGGGRSGKRRRRRSGASGDAQKGEAQTG